MSHHFDAEANAGQEKLALASEGPEWVCSARPETARSETAPIALPSDRGLHVRPDMAEDAPQVREESSRTTAVVPNAINATSSPPEELFSESTDQNLEKPPGPPVIYGLRRRTFWFVAIILLIFIVGAAIGGAVGGVYRYRNQDQNRSPSPTSSPNLITIITSSTSPTPTTGPSPTTSTKPRNDFSLQIWSLPSFTGRTQLFYTPGSFQTAFLARSYIWRPGQYDLDTMFVCSLALCSGSNQLGWWGSSSREQPGYPQNETWGADNVVFECGASFLPPPCPGPVALETFATVPVLESWTGSLTLSVSVSASASASRGATGVGSGTVTVTEGGRGPGGGNSTVSATTSRI